MKYALIVLLLAGCATKKLYWTKEGSTEAQFHSDFAQCKAQAFGVPGAMQNLLQVAVVQRECMYGKGWRQE